MTWQEFQRHTPELAAFGQERFEANSLVLVGTLRKNGWPRISPVEPLIVEGQLYLGMMWQSRKTQDLQRDPRCVVHSAVSRSDGSEGEFKLYGRALEVKDSTQRKRYSEALYQKMGWSPEEGEYHLFALDIESAASVTFKDDKMVHQTWKAS